MKKKLIIKKLNYKHKDKNIISHISIHTHSLSALKLSQCPVGAQSLGKGTYSLRANVVPRETGAGGWEDVSTAPTHWYYSIVSLYLILSTIVFYICFYVLNKFRIFKS